VNNHDEENRYELFGDAYPTEAGTQIVVAAPHVILPPAYRERSVIAESVVIGEMVNGNVAIVGIVGEVAIRLELNMQEGALFAGMFLAHFYPPQEEES